MKQRCPWARKNPLYLAYHDTEWGTPVHDDRKLFEFLILEGAQAGLSWLTILRKRESYREVLDHFDPREVAAYGSRKVGDLLRNPGIIRNRRKVEAAVRNARAVLTVQEESGSFDRYIWSFVGGNPIRNAWQSIEEVPVSTRESVAMARDLRKRGFAFVGPSICYAFMQAVGMVNDHMVDCFRHGEL